MKMRLVTLLLLTSCLACTNDKTDHSVDMDTKPGSEMMFDQEKWQMKDGKDFPYRAKMLNDVVYNDTIRSLNRAELLEMLGAPSYYGDDEHFLYYLISQKRLGLWPLSTKSMVIKMSDDDTVEWIKIHS